MLNLHPNSPIPYRRTTSKTNLGPVAAPPVNPPKTSSKILPGRVIKNPPMMMLEIRPRSSHDDDDSENDTVHSQEISHSELSSSLLLNPSSILPALYTKKWVPRRRIRDAICTVLVVVAICIAWNLTVSSPEINEQQQHQLQKHSNKSYKNNKKQDTKQSSSSASLPSSSSSSSSSSSFWQFKSSGRDTAGGQGASVQVKNKNQNTKNTTSATPIEPAQSSASKTSTSSSWFSFWPTRKKQTNHTANPPTKKKQNTKPSAPQAKQNTTIKNRPTNNRFPAAAGGTFQLVPFKYVPGPPPPRTNVSAHFVERWCDLTGHGSHSVDWYPVGERAWQRRAPAFLIPGTKYSGVQQLAWLLSQHPQISPPQMPNAQFFLDMHFKRYVNSKEVTRVYVARQRMYAHHHLYPTKILQRDRNRISFDATAGYLLYSAVTPRRIFCVAPWVKLIIILQDPLDRLIQHYKHAKQHHGLRLDFQTWVEKDWKILNRVQLTNQTPGSAQEDVAWYDYTSATLEGSMGRSIYEIQLRHWFQAIMGVGKRPSRQVLLLRAEQVVQQPAAYYRKMLQFLGVNDTAIPFPLDPSKVRLDTIASVDRKTVFDEVMTPEFRRRLVEFYKPYQQRLPKTLDHFLMEYAKPTE